MKKLLVFCLAVLAAVPAMAQGGNTGDGGADGDYISLAKKIAGLEKKSENFNLFVNYTAAYQQSLDPYNAAFRAKALRLEIKGKFGDHLSYRFRHRLNGSGAARSEDNFAAATDMAMVGWRFNDKFEIQGGKLCQYWGGFEYDENPMYIYEYCDLLDRMEIFFGGVAFVYNPWPSQEFVFNITNTFTGKFADEYVPAAKLVAGAENHPLTGLNYPFTYIFNWNGSFLDGILKTRWAVGSSSLAKGTGAAGSYPGELRTYLAYLGQMLHLPTFQFYLDTYFNHEDLDRTRIASDLFCTPGTYLPNVDYASFVAKANWQFAPKWNFIGKVMYENASTEDFRNFRTSLGWVGCFEYYPMDDQDLCFFLAYIRKDRSFSQECGLPAALAGTMSRAELGIMYRIKAY